MSGRNRGLDEIGPWSEVKLEIIREYARAYSQILSKQVSPPFSHAYIDAFSGAGMHTSRGSGELVAGSPTSVLRVTPPFKKYHFIDLDRGSNSWPRNTVAA